MRPRPRPARTSRAAPARPGRRRAFAAFALGSATWTAGVVQWTYLELVRGLETPFPAWGDLGYLAAPVCFAAGLFLYGSDAPGVKATQKQIGEMGIVFATMGLTFGFIFGDAIVTVRESGGPAALVVHADASQLEHALVNLGLNAVHAMPRGGRLDFILSIAHDEATGEEPASDWVVFEVRDTGVGIADESLPRIFEPFYSTRSPGEGTGLGLAMVKSTATAHGGRVELRSELGRGTSFRLVIPLHEASALELPARDAEVDAPATGHETILVVDDRGAALLATQAILEAAGYRVRACSRATEALRLVTDEPDVDLLVVDLGLPDTDGIAVATEIRRLAPELPVIVMTGRSRPSEMPTFVSDVLEKPYRPKDLTAAVRRALDDVRAKAG